MKRIKQSRAASFATVTAVYFFATALGIIIYRALDLPWWLSLLIADVCATVITFAFSVIFGNASVYDPYWSVQPPVILAAIATGKAITPLGILLLVTVSLWGIRLTANWAYTFSGLNHQDWRYTMLREKTGVFYPIINFVGIAYIFESKCYFSVIFLEIFYIGTLIVGNVYDRKIDFLRRYGRIDSCFGFTAF